MKILLIILISLSVNCYMYSQPDIENGVKKEVKPYKLINPTRIKLSSKSILLNQDSIPKSIMLSTDITAPRVEYNTTIFCKFEHNLMMSSKLPLKMRLGNLDYVNYLEGKN